VTNAKEKFKEVTEAYAVLSDEKLREKYDQLIYGGSSSTQDYDHWEEADFKKPRPKTSATSSDFNYEERMHNLREKLKKFKDYEDFLKTFEDHREKHEARSHLMREEGWKSINDKFPHYEHYDHVDKEYEHKYDSFYKDVYFQGTMDSKANTIYYSQSAITRAWL